ncbi:MAG: hypothetical protein EOM19_01395 [Candidatus Moranbacteria bacterium]|nr:hypothetical protein [Candidatus Moranbacteria bacterium]
MEIHSQKNIHPPEEIEALKGISWEAKEHIPTKKNKNMLIFLSFFLFLIILYALLTESPIMAITFILIGVMAYININRESQSLLFSLDTEGIHVGRELYPYENIHSFWIFYDPGKRKYLSLHTNGDLTPYVHIPIGDEDPLIIRKILLQFLSEEKHPVRLIDIIEEYL